MQTVRKLNGPDWPAKSPQAIEAMRVAAEGVLPLAKLTFEPLPGAPEGRFDCGAPANATGTDCPGYAAAVDWARALIDTFDPNGHSWVVLFQPETSSGAEGSAWGTPRINAGINVQEDPPNSIGMTLAHEVLHGLGAGHSRRVLDGHDLNYPRGGDGALGPFIGIQAVPALRVFAGQNAAGAVATYDIMSYEFPMWISPYVYCVTMPKATGGRMHCPASVDPGAVSAEDCIQYDPTKLSIVDRGALGWQVVQTGGLILLLLDNRADAQNALALGQSFRALCFFGRNNSRSDRNSYIMEYWKDPVRSSVPVSTPDCVPYDPALVQSVDGNDTHTLVAGSNMLQRLDTYQDGRDAAIVAKRFTKQCFIGRSNTRPDHRAYLVEYWQ
jgi:hypothetical protein